MNSVRDKKEEVFQIALDIAREKGLSNLTIRDLADQSDIAIGSIYNLFGTKEQLVILLIKDYWLKSIENIKTNSLNKKGNFIEKVEYLYISLKEVADDFHKDFIKDIVGVNMSNEAINKFTKNYKLDMLNHIENMIIEDESIKDQFSGEFTTKEFSRFILYNYFILLRENQKDIGFLRISIKRMLSIK